MKCIIPGANIKVFGRAIHSLSKIGDELYVEALSQGLSLRTVNSSRSAYACFLFSQKFFSHYSLRCDKNNDAVANNDNVEQHKGTSEEDIDNSLKCKIFMKSCLSIFKSLPMLEKVEKCKIAIKLDEDRIVFQLCCKHGIVKTHNLTFIECETLQAVFSKNFCPNVLRAPTRLLSEVVVNFQSGQEELSLSVCPANVVVRSYVDLAGDSHKAIRTELTLLPEEFDSYQVGVDTDITFCLKEFKALLSFSEAVDLPVSLRFESAGRPIILSVDTDATFEANFVLATMADPMSSTQQTSSTQQSESAIQRLDKDKQIKRPKTASSVRVDKGKTSAQCKSKSSKRPDEDTAWPDRALGGRGARQSKPSDAAVANKDDDKRPASTTDASNRREASERVANSCPVDDDDDSVLIAADVSSIAIVNKSITSHLNKDTAQASTAVVHTTLTKCPEERSNRLLGNNKLESPLIPVIEQMDTLPPAHQIPPAIASTSSRVHELLVFAHDAGSEEDKDEDEEEFVAGTPPSKKASVPSQPTAAPPGAILAQDSDED